MWVVIPVIILNYFFHKEFKTILQNKKIQKICIKIIVFRKGRQIVQVYEKVW